MTEQRFEWDDAKRQSALAKHGIDFLRAARVFRQPHRVLPALDGPEERWMAIGQLDGVIITVVFTRRGDAIRIITARRARRNERQDQRPLHDG
ncbi:BrnT family toxin [Paracoccus sp. S-4012]|uniref:BrnT family toxin n=1 Tax=Paracoccus sp. S-4012 TaxID=2665648 RepID=UPI0012AF61AB|nr:BrnT family toxin [Paracoccus sp. S-4012]MRX49833.1 BrnT family toxin [Paracoccus sp. S-4012]